MAIGRISGPMLVEDLDRQGLDLKFTTNDEPLVYLDFTRFTMSVRQLGGVQTVSVNGNLSAGNIVLENGSLISTLVTNQPLTISASGVGETIIHRANVQSGAINNTVIGNITPKDATFQTLNSTRLTTNEGRVVFTDSYGMIDDSDLRYFTSNNTLIAGNIISTSGDVGFADLSVGNLTVFTANVNSVGFFDATQQLVTSTGLRFFASNSTLLTANLRLPSQTTNRILFVDSTYGVVGSSLLTFDGTNMNARGITTLGNVVFSTNQISTSGANQDLLLVPAGSGRISVQNRYITDLATPVSPSDAVNKAYVDDRISLSSVNSIGQVNSLVIVNDDALGTANVEVYVDSVLSAKITKTHANLQTIAIHDSTIGTISGRLVLSPYNNDKIQLQTTSAVTLPIGLTTSRPTFPEIGDIRYNTSLGLPEWYTGYDWEQPQLGNVGIVSQSIAPDGVNNVYTLTRTSTTEAVLVNINGVIQQPSQAYFVADDQITFVEVPLVTDIIEIRYFNTAVAYAANPITVDTEYQTVGTSFTQVDSFYTNYYRSAKYTYSAKSASSNKFETGELHVVHDDLEPYYNSQHVGNSTPALIAWSLEVDIYGILRVSAKGLASDTVVKLHRLYFTDV